MKTKQTKEKIKNNHEIQNVSKDHPSMNHNYNTPKLMMTFASITSVYHMHQIYHHMHLLLKFLTLLLIFLESLRVAPNLQNFIGKKSQF